MFTKYDGSNDGNNMDVYVNGRTMLQMDKMAIPGFHGGRSFFSFVIYVELC